MAGYGLVHLPGLRLYHVDFPIDDPGKIPRARNAGVCLNRILRIAVFVAELSGKMAFEEAGSNPELSR